MPKRTRAHEVGDQAVATVAMILSEAGHAVEPVVSDYGEDLLVQTSHAGKMDASRLWFQVKGTEDADRFRLKNGRLKIRVPFEHALRWSRSLDVVIVVLCDVRADACWYAIPSAQIGGDECFEPRQSVGLEFSDASTLTPETAKDLAWLSRIHHYRHLLLSARGVEAEADMDSEERSISKMIVLDLMLTLGLLELVPETGHYQVPRDVRNLVVCWFRAESMENDDYEAVVCRATIAAVFAKAKIIGINVGLSQVVAIEAASALFRVFGFDELFPDDASPAPDPGSSSTPGV